MTLTEFLRARLDEDGRHARKLAESDRRPVLSLATTVNHPERLLLEVEAKRRILEDLSPVAYYDVDRYYVPRQLEDAAKMTLRHLAAIYADHDDYDEGWRP